MIHLPPDFRDFLKLLNSNGVEYLVVGGYAVAYHGYPRTTADIDIWIALGSANAEKAAETVREFGFVDQEFSSSLFQEENTIVRMGLPPLRVEVLTGVSGVIFSDCYKNRIVENIDGVEVSLIGLEDLKANKKASGRHKDLDDLENLPN